MALKIPPSLKVTDLKKLAFLCGISTSGTKASLCTRLADEVVQVLPTVPNHGSTTRSHRILSIDMGIRNLAYCILDKPSEPSSIPSIRGWRRMAVSSAANTAETSSPPPAKESFDPPVLAAAAYNLLRHTLLPYKPDYVLIERQRFRSHGSPHILEWTVRVNMLESMLHAILHALNAEKVWQGQVISILPGKVGPFWIEPVEEAIGIAPALEQTDTAPDLTISRLKKSRKTKNSKLLNKGAKIDLVKQWLETGEMISLGAPEVETTAQGYLERWHRLPGSKKPKAAEKLGKSEVVEEIGKLDDLADSLLQGMAWIQWEQNKAKLLRGGIDALNNA